MFCRPVLEICGLNVYRSRFARPNRNQLAIDQVWLSQREARPGETITLNSVLSGENGFQVQKAAQYRVPVGSPVGRSFKVSDANLLNFGHSLD